MHFDGWNTIEGRHLVFAYTLVFLLQGAYAVWIAATWRKLDRADKKAAKPVI